jgi:hypothetical protein
MQEGPLSTNLSQKKERKIRKETPQTLYETLKKAEKMGIKSKGVQRVEKIFLIKILHLLPSHGAKGRKDLLSISL